MRMSVAKRHTGVIACLSILLTACSGGGGGGSSGGGNNGGTTSEWLLPRDQVVDGGPGQDGIPAIENPQFESAATIGTVADDEIVIVIRSDGQVKAYPQDIMNWHEVLNDGPANAPFTMSYCPLTASSVAWQGNTADSDRTYGVSGLLFNSNLLLYDRATNSIWSQMLQQSVNGPRIRRRPDVMQLFETTFATLKTMYPDAMVLTRDTGHVRDYDDYPYGDYRESNQFIFPFFGEPDTRLHPKVRLIGIHNDVASKTYELSKFGDQTVAINDDFGGQSIVVVGNSALDFAVIYDRELADGSILSFTPILDDLPNVLSDTEGNTWDIFGTAVAGPRMGAQLESTRSYVAMWFAWVGHFDTVELHFN